MRTLLLAAAILAPVPALAGDFVIGAQAEGSIPLSDAAKLGTGYGGQLGYKVDLAIVHLIPEAQFTYYTLSQTAVPKLGGRIRIGKFVEPGAFMHVVMPISDAFDPGAVGFDAGVLFDLTVIPKIDVGLHGGMQFFGDPKPGLLAPDQALLGGVHVSVNI